MGFCFFGLGCAGDLVPDLPATPVYDFFPLADPGDRCGLGILAMFPDDVAPAVACSLMISLIFIQLLIPSRFHVGTPMIHFGSFT